jgi:hypothetical protein
MIRFSTSTASLLALGLVAGVYARSHSPESLLDAVKGVRVASRLNCDGSTNPAEDVGLITTFSPAGWERSFHLDEFENKYCRHVDLYFLCVKPGYDHWKETWVSDSYQPPIAPRAWLNACSAWESKEVSQYVLSGWYKEGAPGNKLPWKQALLKQVSSDPVTYEFTDPNGGTARIEIHRK